MSSHEPNKPARENSCLVVDSSDRFHFGPGRGGRPGLIAFSARRWEGEYRSSDVPGGVQTTPVVGSIATVRADGSDLHTIVGPGWDANAPSFSPDGRWLYFQSNGSGSSAIARCRPDGSEVRSIISPASAGPTWKSVYGLAVAPDGRLVFTVHDGELGHVAIAEADGAKPRVIAPKAGYLYMAAMGPAGDTIVCSGPAGGYRLQRIRLGGADESPQLLTPGHPDSYCPQFTPEGQTIVFFRRDGDIYRVGVDGSDLRRLTIDGRLAEFRLSAQDRHGSSDPPDISPDGRRIAYIAERDGVPNVNVMNLDGSGQRPVTSAGRHVAASGGARTAASSRSSRSRGGTHSSSWCLRIEEFRGKLRMSTVRSISSAGSR